MSKKRLLTLSAFLTMAAAFAQPGFTCANPIGITLPYSATDSTANYGDTLDATWYMAGNDVFYSFTPAISGSISIIMDPVGGYSSIGVYAGCVISQDTYVASMGNSGSSPRIFESIPVTAGIAYTIVISTDNHAQTVDYSLTVNYITCLRPTQSDTGNLGQTTADLSWNNPAGSTDFEVAVQLPGSGMPSGSGIAVTGTSYTATGLDSATTYEYWVRSNCGDGTFSIWYGPGTFTTYPSNSLCPVANQCDYIFNLIDTFGDSWNGNSMNVVQDGNVVATLTQDSYASHNINIPVPLCDGEPFELFWNAGGNYPNEIVIKIINPFGQVIYEKPPTVGTQNSLLFQGTVNCSGPICPAPSNVYFTELSAGTATVAWTELGTATEWEILALPTGSTAPTAADSGIVVPTNPSIVTGLVDGGGYDFYVRAVCSDSSKSDWTLPVSAIASCPPPVTLSTFGGDLANGVSWNPGLASQWEVIVQPSGLPAPDVSVHGVVVDMPPYPNMPHYFLDSATEGTFDVYVRAVCSTSDSVWSAPLTVEITCAQVSDVSITGNMLSWTSNGSASQWEVWVREGNVSYPGGSNFDLYLTSDNPFVVPDMAVGQDYSIFVRSVCGTGDNSIWSSQRHFIFNGLGNPEVQPKNFVIYPNPASRTVSVTLENTTRQLEKITLFDMVGKTVYASATIGSAQTAIDISALAKGVYLMEIETSDGNRTLKKLIKE